MFQKSLLMTVNCKTIRKTYTLQNNIRFYAMAATTIAQTLKSRAPHDVSWKPPLRQDGYAGHSVSQSKAPIVERYIENQKEHHKKETFQEEYVKFLREYNVDFNEKYLWT